jgi:hypothetical protein
MTELDWLPTDQPLLAVLATAAPEVLAIFDRQSQEAAELLAALQSV